MKPWESGFNGQESAIERQGKVVPPLSPDSCPLTSELDDPRMVGAVQEYLDSLETGIRPNREEFLARYQELAEPLAECLDALEFVHMVGPRLEGPVGEPGSKSTPLTSADLAMPLGDFRIIREIGRGGMGVVYEAEQLSLGRRIALKVLPFAFTLDPRHLQRFKNEARAAAHLHHANIVPIYSVGCERGVHFYAMQLVEGQSLAAVIRELRELSGKEGSGLTIDDRRPKSDETCSTISDQGSRNKTRTGDLRSSMLDPRLSIFRSAARLGVQVAEALEHAHQLGVIHRDIKPGNILVDGLGNLWVTDFGLAQFQSDAVLTVTGDVVGTLRYMSPEQALAKRQLVDHRTDLYSLGATLYELLTLEPPFGGRDREELLRQIAFEEPRPPRGLNPAIPTDLETIVLKALAKAPEERYATALELVDDLRRFLEDKPIRARRPTPFEKAIKWCRRHKSLVVFAVVLLAVVAAGLAVTTVQIAHEQAQSVAAYHAEAEQRARAERSFCEARRAVDFFTQVTEEELADRPEMQAVRRKLLEASLEYYQSFIEQQRDDLSLRAELATSYLRVAGILNEIGWQADALAAMEKALQIQDKLDGGQPATPQHRRHPFAIPRKLDQLWAEDCLWLLLQKPVQEDLHLSEDQVRNAQQLRDRRRESYLPRPHPGPVEGRKLLEELAAQERALAKFLQPEQIERLRQIVRQQQGARAFTDPRVTQALRLTDEQKVRIKGIQDGARQSIGSRPATVRGEILNVLTDEQKAHWQEIIGQPFQGELRPPSPVTHGCRPGDGRCNPSQPPHLMRSGSCETDG